MPANSHDLLERTRTLRSMLAGLPTSVTDYREIDDAALLELNRLLAAVSAALGAARAVVAGEVAHRSRPALGGGGLAQRSGFRTVEQFIKVSTGATARDAVSSVRTGILLAEMADDGRVDELTGDVVQVSEPWLRPAVGYLAEGSLSIAALESIRNGLGSPTSAVSSGDLTAAAARLCSEALAGVDPDRLYRRARELRDELDLDGVKLREEERRAARGLKLFARPDGSGRAVWEMDPETFVEAKDLYDRMTSPKSGGARFGGAGLGVRFVGTEDAVVAEGIFRDERSREQLASDGFLQLLRQGADADTRFMLGTGAPVLRLTAMKQAVESGVGVGRLDGAVDPVSIDTVQRALCTATITPVVFDGTGTALEPDGREHRLFSRRQREVLAVKFGGCMDPNCDRPPSWCEAHHIEHWARDRGKTLVANGILLCRYHHLKYHNEGWEIRRDDCDRYWLVPPMSRGTDRTPILMPSKSAAMRDLWRGQETA